MKFSKRRRSKPIGARLAASMAISLCFSGCAKFFPDPKLTNVAVLPTSPTIAVGKTQQMEAVGTYDDGHKESITDGVSWTTSSDQIASLSSTGLVTGVSVGSATISATASFQSGSTSVSVTVADLKAISINPSNSSVSSGKSQQFAAIGTLQNGNTVDVTTSVTWTSSNTAAATINSSGLASAQTVSSSATTNITAKSGSITSNTAVLTVSP